MSENMNAVTKSSRLPALFRPGKPQAVYIALMFLLYYLVPFALSAYAEGRGLDDLEYHLTAYLLLVPALILLAGAVYGFLTGDFYRHILWTFLCGLLIYFTAQFSVPVTLGYCGVMGILALISALLGRFAGNLMRKRTS